MRRRADHPQDDERQLRRAGRGALQRRVAALARRDPLARLRLGRLPHRDARRCTTGASCRRRRRRGGSAPRRTSTHRFKRDLYLDCTPRSPDALDDVVGTAAAVPSRRSMIAYASGAGALARFINDRGLRDWDTIPVLTGAETLLPHDRAEIDARVRPGVRHVRLPRGHADGLGVRGPRRPAHVDGEPDRRGHRATSPTDRCARRSPARPARS